MKYTALLALIVTIAFCSCQEEQGNYRLIEETVYSYGWTEDDKPKVEKVLQYKYREGNNSGRSFDDPRVACDTFLDYRYEHDGAVTLTQKEVRTFNSYGQEDTFIQYAPAPVGMQPYSQTVSTYINDTLPSSATLYVNTNLQTEDNAASNEEQQHIPLAPSYRLMNRVLYQYKDGELTEIIAAVKLSEEDSVLTKQRWAFYKEGKISIEYEPLLDTCEQRGGNKLPVRKEKRYVYDTAGNLLSGNSYIVYEDGTDLLWDIDRKSYNEEGQLLEYKSKMHLWCTDSREWEQRFTYTPTRERASWLSLREDNTQEVKYTYNKMGNVVTEETIMYGDTSRTKVISRTLEETSYTSFGKKKETSRYIIVENEPKGKRKQLRNKTTYTYEQY